MQSTALTTPAIVPPKNPTQPKTKLKLALFAAVPLAVVVGAALKSPKKPAKPEPAKPEPAARNQSPSLKE